MTAHGDPAFTARQPVLETRGLTKSYGGLVAVNNVDLKVFDGEPHAIIGPNGAGKSSLINLLTGHIPPTAGEIMFGGRNIAGLPAHKVARLGIGRSYQRTNIYPSLTCYENCWLAAQARRHHSFSFILPARRHDDLHDIVEDALVRAGLGSRIDAVASKMSYGEQRQLEIAMVLATGPQLLALDEPLAGMGREEAEKVIQLLVSLGKSYPLLLIEHDMDAVFSIAHTMTVMVNGVVIATGPVAEVRSNPMVQEAYLGDLREKY
ncbi:MAG: ABC transporter ATP-binding protein [Xanthobacteraceae bacterium]|nr:MAG: ABC transporter ATP-binding protein [Xanthobacteraceae bacterium]